MARVLAGGQFGAEGFLGVIDDYLAQLREALRVPANDIVAEVEDHLRESAAHVGEGLAIERFGSPGAIAAQFHAEVLERDGRRSVRAVVAAGAVLGAVFLATDLVQPGAPWPDRAMPLALEWKLHAAMLLAQVAIAAGIVALLHRMLGHQFAAIRAAAVALVSAVGALGFHAAFQLDRITRVHTSAPVVTVTIAGVVVRAAVVVAAAAAVVRAERRVRSLSDQPDPERLMRQRTGWVLCAALALLAGFAVFGHDEATRVRSAVDGGIESATVVAAFALLKTRLGLAPAADAAYTVRRTRR